MKDKHKLLILVNSKESLSPSLLKSSISLARMIHGKIGLLYIKRPTDVVKGESQLSAIRTINDEYLETDKEIRSVLKSISEEYAIPIDYTIAVGNLKSEIGKYVKEHAPDIIVVNKRKQKILDLNNDDITNYVLKNFEGNVLMVSEKNVLEPDKKLSLGILNNMEQSLSINFAKELLTYNDTIPLKLFKFVSNTSTASEIAAKQEGAIEYVFEKNGNTINNLSNYLLKSNIDLFCMNKENNNMIDKLDLSLLITENKKAQKLI